MKAPKPRRYAEDTRVPVGRSREQLETLLVKHGAKGFGTMSTSEGRHEVLFQIGDTRIAIAVSAPDDSPQEQRRIWRALLLVVKAKLEAVNAGISTIEREFLADVVVPGQDRALSTVGREVLPHLRNGKLPPLLLGGGAS